MTTINWNSVAAALYGWSFRSPLWVLPLCSGFSTGLRILSHRVRVRSWGVSYEQIAHLYFEFIYFENAKDVVPILHIPFQENPWKNFLSDLWTTNTFTLRELLCESFNHGYTVNDVTASSYLFPLADGESCISRYLLCMVTLFLAPS